MKHVIHELEPIYDKNSKVLILGSIPSIKSREKKFYYAHPQNRFWKILQDLYQIEMNTKEEKIKFLHTHHIALWDVIQKCDIERSSDASIRNITVNDIEELLKKTKIKTIFTTGRKATDLYQKYIYPKIHIESIYLPSTSGANASMKYEKIKKEYEQIKNAS